MQHASSHGVSPCDRVRRRYEPNPVRSLLLQDHAVYGE